MGREYLDLVNIYPCPISLVRQGVCLCTNCTLNLLVFDSLGMGRDYWTWWLSTLVLSPLFRVCLCTNCTLKSRVLLKGIGRGTTLAWPWKFQWRWTGTTQGSRFKKGCVLLYYSSSECDSTLTVYWNGAEAAGCLSRIPDPDLYPSRILDPKTATKERGEKIFVIPFFVATNFTKL